MLIVFALIGIVVLLVLSSHRVLKVLFTVVSGLLLIVFAAFAGVMFSAGKKSSSYT